MWNSVLAGIVFQHDAIEKLRRELGRNLLTGKDNVVYNYKGNVYCYCPKTGTRREMASGGFEKDRNTLKKLCPAEHYGIECIGRAQCPVQSKKLVKY